VAAIYPSIHQSNQPLIPEACADRLAGYPETPSTAYTHQPCPFSPSLLHTPQKKERRLAREKAEEERKAWAAVQEALPSKEELDRIARETDPEDFLNELRAVSENMARLERPVAAAAHGAADDGGASFAKKGFLNNDSSSAAALQPRAPRKTSVQPDFTLRGEVDGAEMGSLELVVKLPTVEAIGDLELDISAEMVHVSRRSFRWLCASQRTPARCCVRACARALTNLARRAARACCRCSCTVLAMSSSASCSRTKSSTNRASRNSQRRSASCGSSCP
jgi:hypothetical protein